MAFFIIIYKEAAYNYHMPKISLKYGMVLKRAILVYYLRPVEEVTRKSFIDIPNHKESCVNFDTERKLINAQS